MIAKQSSDEANPLTRPYHKLLSLNKNPTLEASLFKNFIHQFKDYEIKITLTHTLLTSTNHNIKTWDSYHNLKQIIMEK